MNIFKKLKDKKVTIIVLTLLIIFNSNYLYSGYNYQNKINKTGLIGSWNLNKESYNESTDTIYGLNNSDLLTSVGDPTLTTGYDGRDNQAISFNGSSQYLKQKVYTTKQSTCTMATVASGALFNDASQDFSNYIGKSEVSKPYMLVATDSGSRIAWGYIGEEGTGETLNAELVTNGDMELTTSWANYGANVTTNERSSEQVHAGTYSRKLVVVTPGYSGVKSDAFWTSTSGKLYKLSFWLYPSVVTNIRYWIGGGDGSLLTYYDVNVTPGTWNQITRYYTQTITGVTPWVAVGVNNPGTVYVDDVSVKEVTALAANTGVKIYSTKTGSTQSWANVESGFLPNSIASYEVRKSDFQITVAMTLGAWVNPNGANEVGYIISKSNYTGLGFAMYWDGSGNKVDFYSNGGSSNTSSTIFTESGEWVFVTVTKDVSGNVAFYKNGVAVGTGSGATVSDSSNGFRIGNRAGGTAEAALFNGSIAKPFIYDRALSNTEILNLYNSQRSSFNPSINKTNLIGYWNLNKESYNTSTDIIYGLNNSDQLSAVSDPSLTTGIHGEADGAILFDGSADYLKQKVYLNKAGTCTMATVESGALFNDTGQDFSNYVGKSGVSKPYMLVVTDTGGKVAWGYIGEEGTGESVSNLNTSDFSAGVYDWTGTRATVSGNQDSISDGGTSKDDCLLGYASADNASHHIDGASEAITAGKLYKVQYEIYVPAGQTHVDGYITYLQVQSTQYQLENNESCTNTWLTKSFYVTPTNSYTPAAVLSVYLKDGSFQTFVGANAAGDDRVYIKNIVIDEVTALPANTGVKIYSTKNGSTQSWANVESGFLPNSVASYEVRSTDFQITGAMTVGAWMKSSINGQQGIISKRDYGNSQKSFQLDINSSPYDVGFIISSDGSNDKVINSGTAITDGIWHFVVGVYEPSVSVVVYVDGILKNQNTTSIPATIFDSYTRFSIGNRWNNSSLVGYFVGQIAKPFIYNRVLSATEIYNLYETTRKSMIISELDINDNIEYTSIQYPISNTEFTKWFKEDFDLLNKYYYLNSSNKEYQLIAINY